MLTARITWSPLPGSAPSKLFLEILNSVTALMVRTPLSRIGPLIVRISPVWNCTEELFWVAAAGNRFPEPRMSHANVFHATVLSDSYCVLDIRT
eukprot:1352407-Amphidinium_carterae.1